MEVCCIINKVAADKAKAPNKGFLHGVEQAPGNLVVDAADSSIDSHLVLYPYSLLYNLGQDYFLDTLLYDLCLSHERFLGLSSCISSKHCNAEVITTVNYNYIQVGDLAGFHKE